MPRTEWGWLITPEELRSWILFEDAGLLVINKPGLVICHPSKHGPWSSLVGACREYLGLPTLHMPSRLDRETSGVVVLAKRRELGARLQVAIERGRVRKSYLAVLEGLLRRSVQVDEPIGPALDSAVHIKRAVHGDGQAARTEFVPLEQIGAYTLVQVRPETGRLHQIRVHAAWIGHPVAGDKLYGPDEALFIEFLENGYSQRLRAALPLPRQALHAHRLEFDLPDGALSFEAPLAPDLELFLHDLRTQ